MDGIFAPYRVLAATTPTSGGVRVVFLDLCTLSRPKVVQFKNIYWKENPDWTRNSNPREIFKDGGSY
jgi:hypothetical protein